MISSYHSQLQELATARGVDLKDAFAVAGMPSSTYYRYVKTHSIRYATALSVAAAIHEIANGNA